MHIQWTILTTHKRKVGWQSVSVVNKQLFIALLRQGLDAAYADPNIHDEISCLIRPHPFLRSCGPAFSAQHRQDCWLETLGVKEEVPGSSEAATFFLLSSYFVHMTVLVDFSPFTHLSGLLNFAAQTQTMERPM